MALQPGIYVEDNPSESRYELIAGGELAGFARYRIAGERVVLYDTQIEPAHRGLGLGRVLAEAALEDVNALGKAVVPRCEFIAEFIRKHPQYADRVDPATRNELRPAA